MQTHHFTARMRQRGITEDKVQILRIFGYELEQGKIVLTAKNCKQIEDFLSRQIALLTSGKPCSWLNGCCREIVVS